MLLGLDRGKRGSREPAQDELAIDEQRIGRAIDKRAAARQFLDHDPAIDDRPSHELVRGVIIRDCDSSERDVFGDAVVLDEDRVSIDDRGDTRHPGLQLRCEKKRNEREENSNIHCVFVGAERGSPRGDAFGVEPAE
jgi:hypothetical protein